MKHIVRAHRGRVQVDSAPGKGSTFRIVLPVAPEKTEVLAHAATEAKRV